TVHSAEHLRQVAAEFATFHWMSRMGLNIVSAIGAFVGFCVLYGGRVVRVTSRGAGRSRRRGRKMSTPVLVLPHHPRPTLPGRALGGPLEEAYGERGTMILSQSEVPT